MSHGCDRCKDLVGRFHCGVCGFDGGRSIGVSTTLRVVIDPMERFIQTMKSANAGYAREKTHVDGCLCCCCQFYQEMVAFVSDYERAKTIK